MRPYLNDGDVQVYVGDARAVLAELPERSVHAVLTSPPFYSLRDYGTGQWEGGDPDCAHEKPPTTMNAGFNERWGQGGGEKRQERKSGGQHSGTCPDCGAERVDRQIGLEATPDEWAASLVDVFRACRRVLRDDGSLWVECGDTYASTSTYSSPQGYAVRDDWRSEERRPNAGVPDGLKGKDLVGAPYLLAFALRADGWFWRGAYVWEKPDCMPESIPDRCTVSHSTVLHFAKSGDTQFWTHRDGRGARRRPAPDYRWVLRSTGEETAEPQDGKEWKRVNLWKGRDYFFDRDAIREPFSDYSTGGDGGSYGAAADAVRVWDGGSRGSQRYVRNRGNVPDGQVTLDGEEPGLEVVGPDGRTALHIEAAHNSEQHRDGDRWPSLEGRSPRSVWRITTEANSFGLCPACRRFWPERAPARHCGVDVVAHFAVWPHKLVERILLAATPEGGCCADCGAPRVRRTSTRGPSPQFAPLKITEGTALPDGPGTHRNMGGRYQEWMDDNPIQNLGWQPTCECGAPSVPATALDPFGGSGTTARQARRMGRRCVLAELSPEYAEIASHRLSQQALPLAVEA